MHVKPGSWAATNYRRNLQEVNARIRAQVSKADAKLRATRAQYIREMAEAAQQRTPSATAKLYAAARDCAGIGATLRGVGKRPTPLVAGVDSPPATTTVQSARNFRERWAEVGRDTATGPVAEEWAARCTQACEEARQESNNCAWTAFTVKEIEKAITKGKNNKSAGPDRIPYEIWKLMPRGVTRRIAQLFDAFVTTGSTPQQWNVSKGIPLFKKGDETDAYMYRIISLTDTLFKTYEQAILARMHPTVNLYLHTQQYGFRKGRNTQGAGILLAAASGMGMNKHEQAQHGLTFTAFIDIRKAYPTMYRPAMLTKLKKAGIGGHLFRAVASMYQTVEGYIQVEDAASERYQIETGLREGSVLSPILYSIFINDLLTELYNAGEGVCIAGDHSCRVDVIGYADDIVLVSATAEGLQRQLDIVAQHAKKHFYQVSQSKSNVVVFGDESTQQPGANMWYMENMYNDAVNQAPDHIAETDKYEYLGTWFHKNRTWDTQFENAARKFWAGAADKWQDAGAIRMGAGELVAKTLWESLVAPVVDYDPLITISAQANKATRRAMKPLDNATKAARQAITGGREHCNQASRMATGIHDADTRRSARCATSIARIMKKKDNPMLQKVVRHLASGTAGCRRAKQGIQHAERVAGTTGVATGQRKPSTVRAKDVHEDCTGTADATAREQAKSHTHTREAWELYKAIKRAHGTTMLPHKVLCGSRLGQMAHQQIRATATRMNAYTGYNSRRCSHHECRQQIESNRHAITTCSRYAEARQIFETKTGVRISNTNYIDIMAIDYRKLGVDSKTLATALCELLAQIVRIHTKENKIASVAHSLGSNQRRLIIQTHRSERAPD